MDYSLIVPYFKTPEITRLCLYSIFKFARGKPEVLVVDNAPGSTESGMLREFKKIRVVENPGAPRGSAGNFHALDRGLAQAGHDLVGLLHSDTVFLKEGWDLECFGRLEKENLAALGTFEREANPFDGNRLRDWWRGLRHRPRPGAGSRGKLMLYFLLTRRSTLERLGHRFLGAEHIRVDRFAGAGRPVEVLGAAEMGRLLWHTSNITSLLTGQMGDPAQMARYREKRRELLADERIRELFGPVLPRD